MDLSMAPLMSLQGVSPEHWNLIRWRIVERIRQEQMKGTKKDRSPMSYRRGARYVKILHYDLLVMNFYYDPSSKKVTVDFLSEVLLEKDAYEIVNRACTPPDKIKKDVVNCLKF